jgi:hypothetical protein
MQQALPLSGTKISICSSIEDQQKSETGAAKTVVEL